MIATRLGRGRRPVTPRTTTARERKQRGVYFEGVSAARSKSFSPEPVSRGRYAFDDDSDDDDDDGDHDNEIDDDDFRENYVSTTPRTPKSVRSSRGRGFFRDPTTTTPRSTRSARSLGILQENSRASSDSNVTSKVSPSPRRMSSPRDTAGVLNIISDDLKSIELFAYNNNEIHTGGAVEKIASYQVDGKSTEVKGGTQDVTKRVKTLERENELLREQLRTVKNDSVTMIEHTEKKLNIELNSVKLQLKTSKLNEMEMERELHDIVRTCESKQRAIVSVTNEVSEKDDAIRRLKSEIEQLKKSHEMEKSRLCDSNHTNEEGLAAEIKWLNDELSESRLAQQKLSDKLLHAEDSICRMHEDNRKTKEEGMKAALEAKTLLQEIHGVKSYELDELKNKNKILQDSICEKEAEIMRLQEVVEDAREETCAANQKLSTFEEENASLKQLKLDIEHELRNAKAMLESKMRRLEDEVQAMNDQKSCIDVLRKNLDEVEDEKRDLSEEIEKLASALSGMTSKCNESDSARIRVNNETEQIVVEMKNKLINAEKEVVMLKAREKNRDQQLMDTNDKTEVMYKRNEELQLEVAKHQRIEATLNDALTTAREMNDELNRKLADAEGEIKTITGRLKAKCVQLVGENDSSDMMKKKIEELEARIAESDRKKDEASQEVLTLEMELLTSSANLDASKKSCKSLEEALSNAMDNETKLSGTVKKLKYELDKAKKGRKKSDDNLERARKELRRIRYNRTQLV